MDGYHIALFIHLFAILAATAATAVVEVAQTRGRRAATVAEALEWHASAGRAARTFPAAVLALVLTGGYMIRAGGAWSWQMGWVQAGLTGAVLLLASGAVLGPRARRRGDALRALPPAAAPPPNRDAVMGAIGSANPGLALGVVFVMATKPALATSLAILLIGAAAGIVRGRARARAAAGATARGPEREAVETEPAS